MSYTCGHLAEPQVLYEIAAQYFAVEDLPLSFQLNVPKYESTRIIFGRIFGGFFGRIFGRIFGQTFKFWNFSTNFSLMVVILIQKRQ